MLTKMDILSLTVSYSQDGVMVMTIEPFPRQLNSIIISEKLT